MTKKTESILSDIDKAIDEIFNEEITTSGIVGSVMEYEKTGVIKGLRMAQKIIMSKEIN